jgi:hypothetical protein
MADNDNIENFLDAIADQDFNSAADIFGGEMSNRIHDALDTEKVNVASKIFNEPMTDEDDIEITDEEIEEFIDLDVEDDDLDY